MGNCCAAPVDPPKKKARKKKEKKPNPFSGQSQGGKLVVLKDPNGRVIESRNELDRELGRGEFGITFLCTEKETGERFACKSISKKKLRTAVDIEDVRREVQIMRHLRRHPNIVSLKGTYEDDDAIHLVMELCEGGELFDRIVARRHYTERAAAVVARTIVEVVQAKPFPLNISPSSLYACNCFVVSVMLSMVMSRTEFSLLFLDVYLVKVWGHFSFRF